MKKLIIALLFFLPVLLTSEASFGQLNVGIKVGYNAAKLSTNMDTITSKFKSGFQIGAFVRIGKKLYLQPELYYTTQGGVFSNNVSDLSKNWKQTVKIGSLDVPVLIGFKLINAKIVNLRILAGPAASFVVNKSISEGGAKLGPLTSGDFKSVNWSIQAGAGVDVLMFTLDVRYQIGLNQLVSEVNNFKFDSRNNVWVISLGWKII